MSGLLDVSCVVVWHSEILAGYFYSRHLKKQFCALARILTCSMHSLHPCMFCLDHCDMFRIKMFVCKPYQQA